MISVVVPALNEEDYLPDCLRSLNEQHFEGEYEVIVVDNGSSDGTAHVAHSSGAKVISERRSGIGQARQTGFIAARGHIVASTDADTIVPPDWLRKIERLFERNPRAVAVAGNHVLDEGPIAVRAWLKASIILMPFMTRCCPSLWSFTGANFAVQSRAFDAIGGFDTDLPYDEDTNLCQRLRHIGQIIYSPDLVVTTSGRAFTHDHMGLTRLLRYRPRPKSENLEDLNT